jgi:hypothetical protein
LVSSSTRLMITRSCKGRKFIENSPYQLIDGTVAILLALSSSEC